MKTIDLSKFLLVAMIFFFSAFMATCVANAQTIPIYAVSDNLDHGSVDNVFIKITGTLILGENTISLDVPDLEVNDEFSVIKVDEYHGDPDEDDYIVYYAPEYSLAFYLVLCPVALEEYLIIVKEDTGEGLIFKIGQEIHKDWGVWL